MGPVWTSGEERCSQQGCGGEGAARGLRGIQAAQAAGADGSGEAGETASIIMITMVKPSLRFVSCYCTSGTALSACRGANPPGSLSSRGGRRSLENTRRRGRGGADTTLCTSGPTPVTRLHGQNPPRTTPDPYAQKHPDRGSSRVAGCPQDRSNLGRNGPETVCLGYMEN